jgi:LmbE family N-acetylglucosaminyl deacetylase
LSLKLIRRTAFVGLLLPCLYFGAASATFLYRIHSGNGARPNTPISIVRAPRAHQRIVVFAPHCDDEALGCAGVLHQAHRAGARVRVVMLTNGDGFRVAVERQYRKLRVEPQDYTRFASLRQAEAKRALARLGLEPRHISFLGYPDRGLMALWNENWSPENPYRSVYTRADKSPYEETYSPGTVYCGQNLLDDIKRILIEEQPTDVYVTHPSDDHPDHCAGSAFVTLALKQLRSGGPSWAREVRLRYYLIHRGDWPVPQGIDKDDTLVPPLEMAELDTVWSRRPLTTAQVNLKESVILTYQSQTAVMKRFLLSFARRNELFGEIPSGTVDRVPVSGIKIDGRFDDWLGVAPTSLEPARDSLLRDFQAGADVRAIAACRDARNLYLRVATMKEARPNAEYRVRIRSFGRDGGAGGSYSAVIVPPSSSVPADLDTRAGPDGVEVAIPLRDLNYPRSLALNVETKVAGIQVDRTGYRFLDL